MREKLKKIYIKNSNSYKIMYVFLKIGFVIVGKYKVFKKEAIEAIDMYEPKKLSYMAYKNKFRKLIVFRYIYYLEIK